MVWRKAMNEEYTTLLKQKYVGLNPFYPLEKMELDVGGSIELNIIWMVV